MPESIPFLTAEWRYVIMLNYEIDPAVLAPLIPAGTELDLWEGRTLVSAVGFLFHKTRVLGVPVPLHTTFEEINLRFYVRRQVGAETRRGVVFVKEVVPRIWITFVARSLYGENYTTLPTRRTVEESGGWLCPDGLVEYAWRRGDRSAGPLGRLDRLGGLAQGELKLPDPGSEAEFVVEHYWGYTRRGARRTGEYRVEHPAWRVCAVAQPYLLCNVRALYGAAFEPFLRRRPHSAILAEGSPIAVYPGKQYTVSQ